MKRVDTQDLGPQISLIILSVLFLLGAVGGSLLAMLVSDGDDLASYLGAFWENARDGALAPSFASNILVGFSIPVLVFLMGFSSLGMAVIPLCMALKGFTLAYSVSAIIRVFGIKGFWLAMCTLGAPNLLFIPCLLLVGLFAFRSSAVMASVVFAKQPKPPVVMHWPMYFTQFAVCSVVILGLASFQTFVQPLIMVWIAALV